jgi:hypothetical protein
VLFIPRCRNLISSRGLGDNYCQCWPLSQLLPRTPSFDFSAGIWDTSDQPRSFARSITCGPCMQPAPADRRATQPAQQLCVSRCIYQKHLQGGWESNVIASLADACLLAVLSAPGTRKRARVSAFRVLPTKLRSARSRTTFAPYLAALNFYCGWKQLRRQLRHDLLAPEHPPKVAVWGCPFEL